MPPQFSSKRVEFLKFTLLSGTGWLLDNMLLQLLINQIALPPFSSNILSSLTAAMFVFSVSKNSIFNSKISNRFYGLHIVYAIYTFAVILISSAIFKNVLENLSGPYNPQGQMAIFISKLIITPPQLIMNFCMARFISLKIKSSL